MVSSLSAWRWRARLFGGLVPGVLALVGPAGAAPSVLPPLVSSVPNVRPRPVPSANNSNNNGQTGAPGRTTTAPTASVTALGLAACRQIALQQQPAIAAARSSLAAAIVRQQSLD